MMLVEFRVTNFMSIKETVTLSLVKGQGTELEENNAFNSKIRAVPKLLRSAVIYGANAAGKSNVIKAMQVMKKIVLVTSSKGQAGDEVPVQPFLFDDLSSEKPSEFEVTFIVEDVRYQYGFSATKERVLEEWLLAFPKGKAQHWIERIYNHEKGVYEWGGMGKLAGAKKLWKEATRSNALFFSTAVQFNNTQLVPLFKWFGSSFHITGFGTWDRSFSINLCETELGRNKVVGFLKAADLGIHSVRLKESKFSEDQIPDEIPSALRKKIIDDLEEKTVVEVKTVHLTEAGKEIVLDLNDDESDGTQQIFSLAGPWLDVLEKGSILVVDELNENLHPHIVRYLVSLFHSDKTNPNNAQLIFTTHDTNLLDLKVMRRDQVWFCEKNKEQATELFSLADFSTRKTENIEGGYLSGRYGGVPFVASEAAC